MIQKKCFNFSAKTYKDIGLFDGYASVFNVLDKQGDVIKHGAFNPEDVQGKTILWQHNQNEPIGKIDFLNQDQKGLYIKAKLITEIKKGYEAYKLLQFGVVTGLSIGYLPKKYKIDHKTGARIIESLSLFEVSLVTFPANQEARVANVKSYTGCNYSKIINDTVKVLQGIARD